MRILICGSRDFEFKELIELDLKLRPDLPTIIEGDAPGADTYARIVAEMCGYPVEKYPADWEQYGRKAGPIRNQQMLDEGKPDIVWAYFSDVEKSKGTRDMVTRALKAKLPVYAVEARSLGEAALRKTLGLPEKTIAPDN